MIASLKAYLYNKKLKEVISSRNGGNNVDISFKNVIIFMDGTDGAERKVINKYATELTNMGSTVKQFAYLQSTQEDIDIGIDHYTTKNINWYQIPDSEDLQVTMTKKYDVMIALLSKIEAHHLYVIKSIDADFKIGPHLDENKEIIFGLNIDHKSSLGIPELIKNLKASIKTLSNHA